MRQRQLALYLIVLPLLAQDRAAIDGAVTDASGALVAGAKVELVSTETGLRRSGLTNDRGLYEITPLPVGTYALTISKTGFRATTVNHIELQAGETRTIDAKLEVGSTTESIEVSAA